MSQEVSEGNSMKDRAREIMDMLSLSWEEWMAIRQEWLDQEPRAIPLMIGSHEWIKRERTRAESQGHVFVATKSLQREYAKLDEIEVRKVNAPNDSITGKQLDIALVNYLELVLALRCLPESPRHCWVLRACEGRSYEEVAETMGITVEAARVAVSHAASMLIARIFEPLGVIVHVP